jgi:alpha-galactosidase
MEIEYWRDIPIIEGIVTDSGHSEMAVNMLNNGYIDNMPSHAVVEVPATIDAKGIHGDKLGKIPTGFAGLLNNQVYVSELTVEAILNRSKSLALQALLVDPVIDNVSAAEKTLDAMISLQSEYLGYLRE